MTTMHGLLRDLRFGWRALARTPGVTLTILLSLGIGIGAVATAFAWYEGWVRNPIPQATAQEQLVALNTRATGGGAWAVSYPVSQDWREHSTAIEDLAVFNMARLGMREEGGGVEPLVGLLASANFFEILGVRPMLGRTFRPDEETAAAPVVVLGHAYWQRRFRGDPSIVGRQLNLSGHGMTVIGVAPPRFGGSYTGLTMDLYLPITTIGMVTDRPVSLLQDRGSQWLDGLARLRPGVSLAEARLEMSAIGQRLDADYPNGANTPVLSPLQETGASQVLAPMLMALIGVTGLVLLIACANVANLLLARAAARQREFSVRAAVGAGRGRIIRQLLAESLLLAIGGGVLGVFMAQVGQNALLALIPPAPFPIGMELTLNPGIIGFTAALTLGTVLVFGLLPAVRASRLDLARGLKDGVAEGARGARLRGALVAAQVALTMVALVSAGLFVRGLQRAAAMDPGYADPDRLLLVTTDLRLGGVRDTAASQAAFDQAMDRLRAIPGVTQVAASHFVPLGFGGTSSGGVRLDGYEPGEDENMSVQYAVVTPEYFETVGMPILRGRSLAPTDRADGTPVVVVNEAFTRRFLADQEPVGRRFRHGGREVEIVGVARDARYSRLDEVTPPVIYSPFSQRYRSDLHLHFRTAGDPSALIQTVRRELFAAAPDLPFLDPRTLTQQMVPATLVQRIGAMVLGLFGGVALLLSAIGIYGVVAYTVAQRTRELGIRVALGADMSAVVRLVLGQGLRLTTIGIVAGGALALGAGRLLQSQLFGLNPADPVTFGVLIVVLGAVAIAASLIPARHAAKVDPMVALRGE